MDALELLNNSTPTGPLIYQIADGRLWSANDARFIDALPEGATATILSRAEGPVDADYLRRTLEFYGYPVGPELLTPEEVSAAGLTAAKEERAAAVDAIIVTVDGMDFNGDEVSQSRMTRAVLLAVAFGKDMDTTTTKWVLADDTVAYPTIRQLAQALMLAGEEQTRVWDEPYKEA